MLKLLAKAIRDLHTLSGAPGGLPNYALVSFGMVNPRTGALTHYVDPTTGALLSAAGDAFALTSLTSTPLVSPVISTGLTASGSASNNFGGSTGAFVTSAGANTLSGDVSLAAGKDLIAASGDGILDFSLATGVTKTSTGLFTVSGGEAKSVQALVAAGAVNLTTGTTTIASSGAIAITLAAGTNGQRKNITMITDGGDATLTGTFGPTGTTIVFGDVGDSAELQFINSKWYPTSLIGVTVA